MKKIQLLIAIIVHLTVNSQTKLDYQLNEFFEESSGYESSFKTQYQYDENNYLILLEHLSWDSEEETYINDVKNLYSYDEYGNKIESLLYYWDGSQYILDEKEEFSYNSINKIIEKRIFDFTGAEYEPSSKIEFTYNVDNKLSLYISYSWDGASYYVDGRSIATFNVDGLLEYYIDEVGSESSSLSIDSKEVFTYNSDGKIIERVFYSWDEDEEEFIPENKKVFSLDANSNLLYSIEYEYDEEYYPLYKNEYVYDFTQLQTSFTDPFGVSNIEFSYLTDDLDFFYLQDNPFYNKVLEKNILEYDEDEEIFINESRYIYHYEETANVNEFINNIVSVYPNPTNNMITISTTENIKKCYLYDFTGRVIKETTSKQIDLAPFENGIYVLKIIYKNAPIITKRIIKQ